MITTRDPTRKWISFASAAVALAADGVDRGGREPVSLAAPERLADPAALEAAERSGMAVAERSGARVALRLTHPLCGEALRAGMPATRSPDCRRDPARYAGT